MRFPFFLVLCISGCYNFLELAQLFEKHINGFSCTQKCDLRMTKFISYPRTGFTCTKIGSHQKIFLQQNIGIDQDPSLLIFLLLLDGLMTALRKRSQTQVHRALSCKLKSKDVAKGALTSAYWNSRVLSHSPETLQKTSPVLDFISPEIECSFPP